MSKILKISFILGLFSVLSGCSAKEWHPHETKFGVWQNADTLAVVHFHKNWENKDAYTLTLFPKKYTEFYSFRQNEFAYLKPDLFQSPSSDKFQLVIEKDKLIYKFEYTDKTTGSETYQYAPKSAFTDLFNTIETAYRNEKDSQKKSMHEMFYNTMKEMQPK